MRAADTRGGRGPVLARSWLSCACIAIGAGLTGLLPARAQTQNAFHDWRPIGLQGIAVNALAAAPGRICAGTQGKGVSCLDLRAPRRGWQPAGLDGVNVTGLWIDPARPDLMFAGTDGAFDVILMFRTRDGGGTWEPIGANVPFPQSGVRLMSLVQGVPGSSTVFAAGGSVWRSDDLGETWREVLSQAYQAALEVAPTDPGTIWAGGDFAFTFAPASYTAVTRDGGAGWRVVWETGPSTYAPSLDAAAHPAIDGLALFGYGGCVLRTEDHGGTIAPVLQSPVGFRLDWGPGFGPQTGATGGTGDPAPSRFGLAYAAGSPLTNATDGAEAYLSRDGGASWASIAGKTLVQRRIFDLTADLRWAGVAYAGTDDGVLVFFGAGAPLCHDARAGVDETRLWIGVCPPILAPGPARIGDAIAIVASGVTPESDHIDLGMAHCLVQDADVAFATLEPPDPPSGEALFLLAREEGGDYGRSSDGRPRAVTFGDCL